MTDMPEWWASIGEPSLIAGITLGFAWAIGSAWRRHTRHRSRGMRPLKQLGWFAFSFVGMASYLTHVAAIGLLGIHNVLPPEAVWLMLGTAVLAFCAALMVGRFEEPRALTEHHDGTRDSETAPAPASKSKVAPATRRPHEAPGPPAARHG